MKICGRDISMREIDREIDRRTAPHDFSAYLDYIVPGYEQQWFHRLIAEKCQRLVDGTLGKDRLMVFVPPQHGKSEIVSRKLPTWVLGRDPSKKIVSTSYSADLAKQFSKAIQRTMESEEYAEVFGGSCLPPAGVQGRGYSRTAEMFDTTAGGFYKAVGVSGSLTGTPADIGIIDDPIKDALEANSTTYRERVWGWYTDVFLTRLHNGSKQVLIQTRWHEDDLAGRLLSREGERWEVVSIKAIKEGPATADDPREDGEALWEDRHSLATLLEVRERSPLTFASLYQQDPRPKEGLLYGEGFRTHNGVPYSRRSVVKAYVDTADTGSDYLCCVIYTETEAGNYVHEVLYTQKPMEYTERRVPELLTRWGVERCVIESNNGGRGFARNVERNLRIMGNGRTVVRWFAQTKNKEARIYTHSADVQNLVWMPEGWERAFPEFHAAVTGYVRAGRNAHDDAPDALTGTVEQRTAGRCNAADFL